MHIQNARIKCAEADDTLLIACHNGKNYSRRKEHKMPAWIKTSSDALSHMSRLGILTTSLDLSICRAEQIIIHYDYLAHSIYAL